MHIFSTVLARKPLHLDIWQTLEAFFFIRKCLSTFCGHHFCKHSRTKNTQHSSAIKLERNAWKCGVNFENTQRLIYRSRSLLNISMLMVKTDAESQFNINKINLNELHQNGIPYKLAWTRHFLFIPCSNRFTMRSQMIFLCSVCASASLCLFLSLYPYFF